jgi:hypothetical protein
MRHMPPETRRSPLLVYGNAARKTYSSPKMVVSVLVALSYTGGTITRRNNLHRRSYKPPLKRVGLPDIRLYDPRRSFAALMFENREQLKLVSKMFGTPR